MNAETIGRSILSEIPSVARVYVVLTAVLAHLGLLAYFIYLHMNCDSLCLGVVVYTHLAQYALLGLLLLSAVVLVVKRSIDAYYQSMYARDDHA